MRDVWGASFWTSSKTIDVHLGWVRRKLGDDTRPPDADQHHPRSRPALRDGRQAEVVDHAADAWVPVPSPTPRAPTVAVIGGGQLARMMAEPAAALGIPLRLLAEAEGVVRRPGDPRPRGRRLPRPRHAARGHRRLRRGHLRPRARARPTTCTRWPTPGSPCRPGPDALVHAQDKARDARAAGRARRAVPAPRAWSPTPPTSTAFGFPCVLKTTRGGYDGKGVWFVRAADDAPRRSRPPREAGVDAARRGAGRLPPGAVGAGRPLRRAARRRRTRSSSRCSATASATR